MLGPDAVRSHRARAFPVLGRQLRSPLLIMLAVTAAASFFVVLRSGHPQSADVAELVPGDVIDLQLGEVVPADVRLLATAGLECEESVLTGQSVPAEKSAEAVPAGTPLAELSCCALMG
jgi:Mg2+-importing ATPase